MCDCFAAAPRNSLGDISAMGRLDNDGTRLAFMRWDGESSSSTSSPGGSLGNIFTHLAGSLDNDGAWSFGMSGWDCHRLSRSASPRHGGRDTVRVPSWDFHNLGSWAPTRRRNCDRLSRSTIPRLGRGHAPPFRDGNSRRHISWDSCALQSSPARYISQIVYVYNEWYDRYLLSVRSGSSFTTTDIFRWVVYHNLRGMRALRFMGINKL
jgi:hypothetical protein